MVLSSLVMFKPFTRFSKSENQLDVGEAFMFLKGLLKFEKKTMTSVFTIIFAVKFQTDAFHQVEKVVYEVILN